MNEEGRRLTADSDVRQLRRALSEGGSIGRMVPSLVKRLCRGGAWRDRTDEQTGERWTFGPGESFENFVRAPVLRGLGADVDSIRKLCAGDAEAQDALDEALRRPHGRPLNVSIGNIKRPNGHTRDYALRKLRTEADKSPSVKAVYERVLAGEISPHRGMVECGFRKGPPTPLELLRRAWERASKQERAEFRAEVGPAPA